MTAPAHDLGRGLLATALREIVTARATGDWVGAHATVSAVAAAPIATDTVGSLFRGAPAVAFVLHTAGHPAYRQACERLAPIVDDLIRARLRAAHRRMASGRPPRLAEFDLISGLTGLGALLLHRGGPPELLTDVLTYLVRLLDVPLSVDGVTVPGWWSSDTPRGVPAACPESGHANFGLAHGLAGPVALLALAARAGHEVPDQRGCLHGACELLEHRAQLVHPASATTVVRWPETLAGARAWAADPPPDPPLAGAPTRPSWCYGTPGVARALQLAAIVCRRPSARRLAEDALAACLSDHAQLALLDDSGVCHGWAGLRLTAARAAADADPTGNLRRLSPLPERPAADTAPARPGLLVGDDGPQLVGHTVDPATPAPVVWDICLLLNGKATP